MALWGQNKNRPKDYGEQTDAVKAKIDRMIEASNGREPPGGWDTLTGLAQKDVGETSPSTPPATEPAKPQHGGGSYAEPEKKFLNLELNPKKWRLFNGGNVDMPEDTKMGIPPSFGGFGGFGEAPPDTGTESAATGSGVGVPPSASSLQDTTDNSLEAQANAKPGDIINGKALTQGDINWAKEQLAKQAKQAEPEDTGTGGVDSTSGQGEKDPAAVKTAEGELDNAAPTPQDKNNLQEAAKRVLGLTGDKKKDAMKWLALSVSAMAHGWRGEPSPLVQMIMDDYKARREQNVNIENREDTQAETRATNEWNAANDEKKMALTQEYSKELARLGLELDKNRAATMSGIEFDAIKRMDNYIKQMGPDEYAKLQRAKGGTTELQQTLSNIAQGVGIGGNLLQSVVSPLFLLGKK